MGCRVVSDDCGCIFRPSASWLAVADDLVYKGIEDGRCLAPDFFVYERLCLVVYFYCGRSTTFVSSMCFGMLIWKEVPKMTSLLLEMGKKNSSSRDSHVFFLFSGVLFVNEGMYCTAV